MSSLSLLPAISCAFNPNATIAIMTANKGQLMLMEDLIMESCHVDTRAANLVMVGCEDVPGFEAVAKGEKVDTVKVGHASAMGGITLFTIFDNSISLL